MESQGRNVGNSTQHGQVNMSNLENKDRNARHKLLIDECNRCKRIFLLDAIHSKKIPDLFVVDLKHLHSNLIAENIMSALSCVKQVVKSPVINSPVRRSHIVWTTLFKRREC